MARTHKLLWLGSLLGAGLIWLNTTKKGQELRDQALGHAEQVYDRVKERLQGSETWDKLSRSRFGEVVSEVADEYSREHGLGENVKRIVVRVVNSQWGHLRKEGRRMRRT